MIQRMVGTLFIICLSVWVPSLMATSSPLDKLIHSVEPKINMSIEVLDLDTNTILYQRNPNRQLIPASNMKLFSDAAAAMILGPDYQFHNQLSMQGKTISLGTLNGHVYLHLPGDPSFSQTELKTLFESVKEWPIHHIRGDIIIDSPYQTLPPYAPGILEEDIDFAYGAPIAPLMLDQNRFQITINPAGRIGAPAIIEYDTPYPLTIVNKVRTAKNGRYCDFDFNMDAQNTLTVEGCIHHGRRAIVQNLAIRNPFLHAKKSIQRILKQQGIELQGKITLGKAPQKSLLLADIPSPSLAFLIAETMKASDNLYADSLFLHAATQLGSGTITWKRAQQRIFAYIKKEMGLPMKGAKIVDGSGLSRENRLNASQTVQLLRFLHQHFALTYEYIAALPVSGRDGTLQKRLRKPTQIDRVRAKTGTMRGIISLSGFLDATNGHTLAFAIYINKSAHTKVKQSQKYRYLIDALCQYFLKHRPNSTQQKGTPVPKRALSFQTQASQAEQDRQRNAQWRQLERKIKKIAKQKNLTVVYRPDELIIYDTLPTPKILAKSLRAMEKKTPFAAVLKTTSAHNARLPLDVLWEEVPTLPEKSLRTWSLRPLAGTS